MVAPGGVERLDGCRPNDERRSAGGRRAQHGFCGGEPVLAEGESAIGLRIGSGIAACVGLAIRAFRRGVEQHVGLGARRDRRRRLGRSHITQERRFRSVAAKRCGDRADGLGQGATYCRLRIRAALEPAAEAAFGETLLHFCVESAVEAVCREIERRLRGAGEDFPAGDSFATIVDFIGERWGSQRAVLWGEQLAQAELMEALHCGLFAEDLCRLAQPGALYP
mgnify:CR=1 FL=1